MRLGLVAALILLLLAPWARAQVVNAPFDSDYQAFDLGQVPGLPLPQGGLQFPTNDVSRLLVGGAANSAAGAIYSIDLVRDGQGHVVGFSGTAQLVASAAHIDGGLAYPTGSSVLFFSAWPSNAIGEIKAGSSVTDKVIALAPLGVAPSHAALNFVPPGFPAAGHIKLVSWSGGEWYDARITPDGSGTFDLVGLQNVPGSTLGGGPEGFVYVPQGSPQLPHPSLLVAEWSNGAVVAYDVDSNGDPIVATRRTFISSLSGAEGAVIDPVTGDFLFTTFGGGDRVVVVQGFAVPPTIPALPTVWWAALLLGLLAVALAYGRATAE